MSSSYVDIDSQSQIKDVALQLSLGERDVSAVVQLLDSGATVPFIARYRKEATGNLDEVAIARIRDLIIRLRQMDERRQAIISSLKKRGLLTEDILTKLLAAESLAQLEDIYLPFRPKRKTRASAARERGLEPLARMIFAQPKAGLDPEEVARAFVDPSKGLDSPLEALAGARDIMAEWMSEDAEVRAKMRIIYQTHGVLRSQSAKGSHADESGKYRDYLDLSLSISQVSPHRLLAMLRGARDGALSLHLAPADEDSLAALEEQFIKGDGSASEQVMLAAEDSYRRLLAPSMENETMTAARARAEEKAIEVFAENLRSVLLEPPMGSKRVLAVDPGFRTGCKLAVLDSLGRLQESGLIYPYDTLRRREEASSLVEEICKRWAIEVIAVGNGTAGRETEAFLKSLSLSVPVVMVNESGASVYSTSEVARQEFPEQDATVRGAVSIGRRLMDPLAELVKIEPKAIGIGQYQHDVDQSALRRALDDVVISCVNLVGVDLNAASRELLTYVSGLGPKLAEAVVRYRNEHGRFSARQDLLKVPRLGPKAFEQAAGFLRISDSDHPLDGTAVHPESYSIVERMAEDLGVSVRELMRNEGLVGRLDPKRYLSEKAGEATVKDIMAELSRPGRDPRREFEAFSFASGVEKMEDLVPGMKLPGIVTNVTAFGAFVDIGVHQDGLVHISQLRDCFVKNPTDVVKARQRVTVRVLDVDLQRKRISLSMKKSD
ncbi:MAG: RNA-binding transcriptional accessory protein [Methanothrix sp.]|nr:RNA-binding transcriptional accessory protein [Methanothrix sp.]